jgi:signal transduction histidine kinase
MRARATIRVRIAGIATAVVAAALVAGAGVLGFGMHTALLDGVRASADAYAGDLADRVDAAGPSGAGVVRGSDDDDRFAQLLDDDGTIVAASESAEGLAPVAEDDYDENRTVSVPGEDSDYLLSSEDTDDGTIVVGQSTDEADETLGTVVTVLVVAVPLVILLVGATTWVVVGRALRPVERMRREVDEVTASSLHTRLDTSGADDEIDRLATTLNSMLDRLDASQAAQRRFISDASHELRSPLASLRQFAEVARRHPDRVSGEELSDAILDEGARLERLVDGMLTLAKADERSLAVPRRAVDLDDLVLAEARRLRSSSTVRVDSSAVGPARVLGDPGLLAQLLRNLVDNAQRHAAGAVRLELSETPEGVLIAVEDDGAGIAPEQRERVFDRFVRLDDARARESGGSGLGLAIVREIALAHDGTVLARNGRLGGARIEIRLPAASAG